MSREQISYEFEGLVMSADVDVLSDGVICVDLYIWEDPRFLFLFTKNESSGRRGYYPIKGVVEPGEFFWVCGGRELEEEAGIQLTPDQAE